MFQMFRNSRLKSLALVALVTLKVVFLDQITKILVDSSMPLESRKVLIKNFLFIANVRNRGIVFGLFYGHREIFLAVTVIATMVLISLLHKVYKDYNKLSFSHLLAYGFIVGGGLGNTIDRVWRGSVVDFIGVRFISEGILNVADIFVCLGAFILIFDDIKAYLVIPNRDSFKRFFAKLDQGDNLILRGISFFVLLVFIRTIFFNEDIVDINYKSHVITLIFYMLFSLGLRKFSNKYKKELGIQKSGKITIKGQLFAIIFSVSIIFSKNIWSRYNIQLKNIFFSNQSPKEIEESISNDEDQLKIKNFEGELHRAVLDGDKETVVDLLKKGATKDSLENEKSPLDLAVEMGNEEIIKILEDN